MRTRMRAYRVSLALTVVFATSLVVALPAMAADKIFTASQLIAREAYTVDASMGLAGDAVVAWCGRDVGVFVARRGALDASFGAPQVVAADATASRVQLARNDRGDVAMAWLRQNGTSWATYSFTLRLAVAAPGGGFGPARDVLTSKELIGFDMAIGDDGSLAFAYLQRGLDGAEEASYVIRRTPAGVLKPPRQLGTGGMPTLAAGAGGTLDAVWTQKVPSTSRRGVFAATAPPGSPFGKARMLSDPAANPGLPSLPGLRLVSNRRGDLLAAWSVATKPPGDTLVAFADRVDAALRPAGGDWSAPRPLGPGGGFGVVDAALNDAGDGVVAWSNAHGLLTAFRPATGDFGAPRPTGVATHPMMSSPIALDALGNLVILTATAGFGTGPGITATVRARDASTSRTVLIPGSAGLSADSLAMSTDPYGNGIVAWYTNGSFIARLATYSALPPLVGTLRVRKRDIRMVASEAARLRITVRARRRGPKPVTLKVVARPGVNKVRFNKRMRRLLRRKGRYTMTVRTRDAGPSAATYKVRFRRR